MLSALDAQSIAFPEVHTAEPSGLLAIGGDLSVPRLLEAYRRGIFPWYEAGQPILWWSPDPRCIIRPASFVPSKSLAKHLKKQDYTLRIDSDFVGVIEACQRRAPPGDTWITAEMAAAYVQLFEAGHAHSVECYLDGNLAGGLYGVSLGNLFFGESMFHRVPGASKIAFAGLMRSMAAYDCPLVDCQLPNPHLLSLGAQLMPRHDFIQELQQTLATGLVIDWQQLHTMPTVPD